MVPVRPSRAVTEARAVPAVAPGRRAAAATIRSASPRAAGVARVPTGCPDPTRLRWVVPGRARPACPRGPTRRRCRASARRARVVVPVATVVAVPVVRAAAPASAAVVPVATVVAVPVVRPAVAVAAPASAAAPAGVAAVATAAVPAVVPALAAVVRAPVSVVLLRVPVAVAVQVAVAVAVAEVPPAPSASRAERPVAASPRSNVAKSLTTCPPRR